MRSQLRCAIVVVPSRKPVRADSLRFSSPSNSLQSVMPIVVSVLGAVRSLVRSRAALHLEILALRHQLLVLERSRRPRVRLTATDRLLWAWFSHIWTEWRAALVLVKPDTVVAWHRRASACSGRGRADTARARRTYRPMSAR